MKNVIVVALGGARYAIELRWVREVFTLGHITPVPHAPAALTGVVNYRGAIVPVMHAGSVARVTGEVRQPRQGDGAVLLEVEGVRAALAVDNIDSVATLSEAPGDGLVDARGREVALLEPPSMLAAARVDEDDQELEGDAG